MPVPVPFVRELRAVMFGGRVGAIALVPEHNQEAALWVLVAGKRVADAGATTFIDLDGGTVTLLKRGIVLYQSDSSNKMVNSNF
ncbi:MAG: hypothetical protein KC492_13405 [Myxococcales bacterium]|nr:hypothetical protein [Myxococcales bacterium]